MTTIKQIAIRELKTGEPFESLFPIDARTLAAVIDSMKADGYDPSQIVTRWRGVVIDGHTRLAAARAAGVGAVPVVDKEFATEDEAVEYAIHLQRDRRNLTDADIARFVMELDRRKKPGERTDLASSEARSGKSAEQTAEITGTSRVKVEKIRTIQAHAAPEVKAAVLAGEKTIHAAYRETQERRRAAQVRVFAPEPAPAPTIPVKARAGQDLARLERGGDKDEGATATSGTVTADPPRRKQYRGSASDRGKFERMANLILEQLEAMKRLRPEAIYLINAESKLKTIAEAATSASVIFQQLRSES